MAAGERAAIVAELRQQTDRILHGRRTMIGESAWYHGHPPWRGRAAEQGRHQDRGPARVIPFKVSNFDELCAAGAIVAASGADECTKSRFVCTKCSALAPIASVLLTQLAY